MFVAYMAWESSCTAFFLKNDYPSTGMMRPEAESQKLMHLMILAHVLLAGAFTWIYARGVENKPWLGQGLRFGLAVAVLAVIPIYAVYYVVQPTPGELAVKQIVFDTICHADPRRARRLPLSRAEPGVVAGYSGTPLAIKLGIKPGMTIRVVHAPKEYRELLAPLPDGARIASR